VKAASVDEALRLIRTDGDVAASGGNTDPAEQLQRAVIRR
jgi:hypothetical protein